MHLHAVIILRGRISVSEARSDLRSWSILQQGVDEGAGVEWLEILDLLAGSQEIDRNLELANDRKDRTTLRRAVDLRQDQAGHPGRLLELPSLDQSVLAGRRIQDQQGLLRSARVLLTEHAVDLA